jgi:hypothetical protein
MVRYWIKDYKFTTVTGEVIIEPNVYVIKDTYISDVTRMVNTNLYLTSRDTHNYPPISDTTTHVKFQFLVQSPDEENKYKQFKYGQHEETLPIDEYKKLCVYSLLLINPHIINNNYEDFLRLFALNYYFRHNYNYNIFCKLDNETVINKICGVIVSKNLGTSEKIGIYINGVKIDTFLSYSNYKYNLLETKLAKLMAYLSIPKCVIEDDPVEEEDDSSLSEVDKLIKENAKLKKMLGLA